MSKILSFVYIVYLILPCITFAGVDDNLVASYQFNGNSNDESGNNNNGAMYGVSFTEDMEGRINSAVHFDGINDYIEIMDDVSLYFGYGDFTISFWVRPESIHNYQRFISKYHSSGGWIIYGNEAGRVYVNFDRERSFDLGFYEENEWQHFTLVKTSASVSFYKNGGLVKNYSSIIGNTDSSQNILIGTCGYGCDVPDEYLKGSMDDIRIYNRALSGSETMELFSLSSSCTEYNKAHIDLSSIQAYSSRYKVTGTISINGSPVCGLVLANGAHTFTCNSDNYGDFELSCPLDANQQITIFGFVDDAIPYRKTFSP